VKCREQKGKKVQLEKRGVIGAGPLKKIVGKEEDQDKNEKD